MKLRVLKTGIKTTLADIAKDFAREIATCPPSIVYDHVKREFKYKIPRRAECSFDDSSFKITFVDNSILEGRIQ